MLAVPLRISKSSILWDLDIHSMRMPSNDCNLSEVKTPVTSREDVERWQILLMPRSLFWNICEWRVRVIRDEAIWSTVYNMSIERKKWRCCIHTHTHTDMFMVQTEDFSLVSHCLDIVYFSDVPAGFIHQIYRGLSLVNFFPDPFC